MRENEVYLLGCLYSKEIISTMICFKHVSFTIYSLFPSSYFRILSSFDMVIDFILSLSPYFPCKHLHILQPWHYILLSFFFSKTLSFLPMRFYIHCPILCNIWPVIHGWRHEKKSTYLVDCGNNNECRDELELFISLEYVIISRVIFFI